MCASVRGWTETGDRPSFSVCRVTQYRQRLVHQVALFVPSSVGLMLFLQGIAPCFADDKISVPILWVGIEGAPSMVNPGVVGESTTDNVLWRRHERPTDEIYLPFVEMSFRSGATSAIKNGPLSFPIIRDPLGSGGNVLSSGEAYDSFTMAKRAWAMGDPLYYDSNNSNAIDDGTDTLLSIDTAMMGFVDMGHDGATLNAAPGDVRYVDANMNTSFDIGERIYRDENMNGQVDGGDTLLVNTLETVVGNIVAADSGQSLLNVPAEVKFLDLIREPANTYNIGYPDVKGIVAVSANDFEIPSLAFSVHGMADAIGGTAAIMDDPVQYLPPGPDYTLFETQLVGHEFGHVLGLPHGDTAAGGGPAAPIPDAGPGTLCDTDNMMQYCWHDTGPSGVPNLTWIGVGPPSSGNVTASQRTELRQTAEDLLMAQTPFPKLADESGTVLGGPLSRRSASARTDAIGDVAERFGHVDIADFGVAINEDDVVEFVLNTRRAYPNEVGTIRYYMSLDIDGDPTTGGDPASIGGEFDPRIPSLFSGAEYVVSAALGDGEPALLLEFNGEFFQTVGTFDALRITQEAIIDFPGEPSLNLNASEQILVPIPQSFLGSFADRFAVEFLSVAEQGPNEPDIVDRAATRGMGFQLPVFPECSVSPISIARNQSTTVEATGLLPEDNIHLLLGADQIAEGVSDANGNLTIELAIPEDARLGDRLVTLGSHAVTADCFVTIVPEPSTPWLLLISFGIIVSRRLCSDGRVRH